jgi:hypothetical protein
MQDVTQDSAQNNNKRTVENFAISFYMLNHNIASPFSRWKENRNKPIHNSALGGEQVINGK